MKKYKLTKETISWDYVTLHRIEALTTFTLINGEEIHPGNKGGWVESENNLSHEGNCWILDEAVVCDNAKVCDEAIVCDHARVYNNAYISGCARVCDHAQVYNNAYVSGRARVCDHVRVCDHAKVYEDVKAYGDANIFDSACVFGCVHVCADVYICGRATITGDAIIKSVSDYIVFKNWWSSGRYFTWTRSNNMWKVGCFYGTGEQLIKKASKDSGLSGQEYERIVKYVNDTHFSKN